MGGPRVPSDSALLRYSLWTVEIFYPAPPPCETDDRGSPSFSHILYCVTLWGGCTDTQRHRVQKVLNHAARIVTCSRRRDHVSPILKELKWKNVDSLIRERDILTVYKLLHLCNTPENLKCLLVRRREISLHHTRAVDRDQLQLPRVHSERARRFFSFRAISGWNSAPEAVKSAGSVHACRRQLRNDN